MFTNCFNNRKIEYLFLSILLEKFYGEIKFKYIETERNAPIKLFFNNIKNINPNKEISLTKSNIDYVRKGFPTREAHAYIIFTF